MIKLFAFCFAALLPVLPASAQTPGPNELPDAVVRA